MFRASGLARAFIGERPATYDTPAMVRRRQNSYQSPVKGGLLARTVAIAAAAMSSQAASSHARA